MPRVCVVQGCSNRSGREVSKRFYGFPSVRDNRGREIPEGLKRRQLWLKAISKEEPSFNLRHAAICSDHFLLGRPADSQDVKHPDYVPTLNLKPNDDHSDNKQLAVAQSNTCCVPGCPMNVRRRRNVTIFSFPKKLTSMQRWMNNIPREDWSTYASKTPSICSLHFHDADLNIIEKELYFTSKNGTVKTIVHREVSLKDEVTPSLFPYYEEEVNFDIKLSKTDMKHFVSKNTSKMRIFSDPSVVVEKSDSSSSNSKKRRRRQVPEFTKVYILDDEGSAVSMFDESKHVEETIQSDSLSTSRDEIVFDRSNVKLVHLNFDWKAISCLNDHTYYKYSKEPFSVIKAEEVTIKDEQTKY